MNPTPILPFTVDLVLQYISPPSQIDKPLPPHLISKSLLQRHHFLSLRPDEPEEYLCWPSLNSKAAIERLESLQMNTDNSGISDGGSYYTRYTSDAEHTNAHVQVTSEDEGLRLVFEWDSTDGWKYHDAALMPFPSHSHHSLEVAMSAHLHSDLNLKDNHEFLDDRPIYVEEDNEEINDDSYWDAYGQEDDQPAQGLSEAGKEDTGDDSEDSYWAQYAAVQGTADSTIPSPVVPTNRKPGAVPYSGRDHGPIIYSYSDMHPSTQFSHIGTLSPNILTERLNAIVSKGDGRLSPSSLFDSTDSDSATPSPPPDTLSDGASSDSANPVPRVAPPRDFATSAAIEQQQWDTWNQRASRAEITDEEEALRETIRGIYKLWKAGRKGVTPQLGSHAGESETFLRIVREVVE